MDNARIRNKPDVPPTTVSIHGTKQLQAPRPRSSRAGPALRIEGCEFPDDLLYDPDGLAWAREEADGVVRIGITSILAAVAGRITRVTGRPTGVLYERGRAVGTVESGKYFGPIRTPVGGTLIAVNDGVLARSKTLSERPYAEGWFARVRPTAIDADRGALLPADRAAGAFAGQISALRVRCFAAFPDYEMVEIGTECAAVLSKLNELLAQVEPGAVVHIASDDPTAEVEMRRWSEETRRPLVDSRREGTLFHFLVRNAW